MKLVAFVRYPQRRSNMVVRFDNCTKDEFSFSGLQRPLAGIVCVV